MVDDKLLSRKINFITNDSLKNEHARNHTYAGHVHQQDEEQAQIYHWVYH